MYRNLTLHIVNSIPWANLNRDDTGTPKRLTQGGVLRGQLSSQSIKRAARVDYENASMDVSYRSGNLAELVLERALELESSLDVKKAKANAEKMIGRLTKGDKAKSKEQAASGQSVGTEDGSDRSAWLSAEELEVAAEVVASSGSSTDFIEENKTGSLAIAAFGRMFANDPSKGTEAAVSVSPAVATHRTVIENDYFSTVDDNRRKERGQGATYLGIAQYLTGVFYRTITIDREQLRETWTGISAESARTNLELLGNSLIYKLPRGKQHATAPYVMPAVVLCEDQAYRLAYDFETPVQADREGGYLDSTVRALLQQRAACLRFDPENFGPRCVVGGTMDELDRFALPILTRGEIVDHVVDWILS